MNNPGTELDVWLAGGDVIEEHFSGTDNWFAGFDPDRQAVFIKIGPYKKIYSRPQIFTKRFYHRIYPLKVESWTYFRQLALFDDFCNVEINLDLHFQATLGYVQRNSEWLDTINEHIKLTYADLLDEVVNCELQSFDDGVWIENGLLEIEKAIVNSICEQLAVQHIQSQAICNIAVNFPDFPSLQPGRNKLYLHALKKTFEINEHKNRELYRQKRLLEQQELQEKYRQLEHVRQLTELELQAQAMAAEKNRRLLAEQETQYVQQLAIEKRIYAEKIKYEAQLKDMLVESELRSEEQKQEKQRLAESRQLTDLLDHQAKIHERKVLAEIQRRENARNLLQEAELQLNEIENDLN